MTAPLVLQVFMCFFKVGLFSFGGGYAMIPLIQHEIVVINGWMTLLECVDLIGISGMGPGPIATNSATLIGYRVAGMPGATAATIGVVLPAFIIANLLTWLLSKYRSSSAMSRAMSGIRPVVMSLIGTAALVVAPSAVSDLRSIAIAVICFVVLTRSKVHPILVLISSGILGVLVFR
jgi:chromate transporter